MGVADALKADVFTLAGVIGERNVTRRRAYADAAAFIEKSLPSPSRQTFEVDGVRCANIESEIRGNDEIIIVGAHYDTVIGSPGADDNASGVAAMISIAQKFAAEGGGAPQRTIRFVAFANEEAPFFSTPAMGSLRYAERCRDRHEKIVAMFSLETIGYFNDAPRSQQYPAMLHLVYPPVANFIAFVSNLRSRRLLRRCMRSFSGIPAESGALPEWIAGVTWSDQWSFWRCGYPAVMVTDTAPYRNPHYHTASDKPETLDYERLQRVVEGLAGVLREMGK